MNASLGLGIIAFLSSIAALLVGIVYAFKRRWKRTRTWGIAAAGFFVGFIVCCILYSDTPEAKSDSAASARAQNTPVPVADQPVATEEPTPTDPPTLDPVAEKQRFFASIDESISGHRIAGNPLKFRGDHVDLRGTVSNVIDEHEFNFDTGYSGIDANGNYFNNSATIVVTCDSTTDLEADEKLRVIGTVVDSMNGQNAMGAQTSFPTVEAKYIDQLTN